MDFLASHPGLRGVSSMSWRSASLNLQAELPNCRDLLPKWLPHVNLHIGLSRLDHLGTLVLNGVQT